MVLVFIWFLFGVCDCSIWFFCCAIGGCSVSWCIMLLIRCGLFILLVFLSGPIGVFPCVIGMV